MVARALGTNMARAPRNTSAVDAIRAGLPWMIWKPDRLTITSLPRFQSRPRVCEVLWERNAVEMRDGVFDFRQG
jgi:hypothetical protein